jgi:MFS family permease
MSVIQKLKFAFSPEGSIAEPGVSKFQAVAAGALEQMPNGAVYAFSILIKPISKLMGCSPFDVLCVFTLAIFMLGYSGKFFGGWVGRVGPRKAMLVSTICFAIGQLISAGAIMVGSLPLLFIGYGLVGGIGLGIGYLAPIKMLAEWFPGQTGRGPSFAIAGFGVGAPIFAPLAAWWLSAFSVGSSYGALPSLFVFMAAWATLFGTLAMSFARMPFKGYVPKASAASVVAELDASEGATVEEATPTLAFKFMKGTLFCSIAAGITFLGLASPLSQSMLGMSPESAAALVACLGFSNLIGRPIWGSLSDFLGRKLTFGLFAGLATLGYLMLPSSGPGVFLALACLNLSFYGGAFATIPAYLTDLFGRKNLSAIHGKILPAWSWAAVLGAVVSKYLYDYLVKTQGMTEKAMYSEMCYVMAGLTFVMFVLVMLIKRPAK